MQVQQLTDEKFAELQKNEELEYIIKGSIKQPMMISALSVSDSTPKLNQEITVTFKVRELVGQVWYGTGVRGTFAVEEEECKNYLRLDAQDNAYDITGVIYNYYGYLVAPNAADSHTIRVVNMPNKDTTCTVSFSIVSGTNQVLLDKRSVTIEL